MTTTAAPTRVRATAQVGASETPSRGRATLTRRRRTGYLGAVHVLQLIALETVVVLVVFVLRNSMWMLVAGVAGAVVITVVTFGRIRGRWWVERVALRSDYRRRRTTARLLDDDRRLAAIQDLAPDLTVHTVEAAGGEQIGVARDGAGWFAIVAVMAPEGIRGESGLAVPLQALIRSLADADQPGTVLQVVTHTMPAPANVLDGDQLCQASYRELMDPLSYPVAVDQVVWAVVRIDAQAVAEASVHEPDVLDEVPKVLTALVRRVGKTLKRAGLSFQILDGDGVLDALVRSLDLEPRAAGQEGIAPVEEWRRWRSARLAHASYWLKHWPSPETGGELVARLSTVSAAMTSVALTLSPGRDGTDIRCLARVADRPEALAAACDALGKTAADAGGRLFRLDGEHAPGAYATAPTGGGAK
jgi:type VII secretion protein EccE